MEETKDVYLGIWDIPQELKDNALWGVSTMTIIDPKTGRRDKAPRCYKTGKLLRANDPEGWGKFEDVVNAGYPAMGFRLPEEGPWVVLDLDSYKGNDPKKKEQHNARIKKISDYFKFTYQERSFSGTGFHIFLKGEQGPPRRREGVELYSQNHYIICTGNAICKAPIAPEGQHLAKIRKALEPDMQGPVEWIDSSDQKESDQSIIDKMFSAANGDKVKELFRLDPRDLSEEEIRNLHSEGWSGLDARLVQHIVFYTQNHDQIMRIFRSSKLYRGNGEKTGYRNVDKYENDYLLNRTFMKALKHEHERKQQEVKDAEEARKLLKEKNKKEYDLALTTDEIKLTRQIPDPGGLVGDIAKYTIKMAHKPLWESGVAAGLTLISGMAGRQYNIDGQGLGLYTILIADTGRGKDSGPKAVDLITSKVAEDFVAMEMFRGPSTIASGQGLLKVLAEASKEENIPSKFSLLGEIAHDLNIWTSKNASSADIRTRKVLLDLFSKTSWGTKIAASAHADNNNKIGDIVSPNFAFLGDTTPQEYFKAVTVETIGEGLIPRFLHIEYDGPRPESNYDKVSTPSRDLIEKMYNLASQVIQLRNNGDCLNIGINDDALKILREFEIECDERINSSKSSLAEIWNRAYQKAMRVAGTIAVGKNPYNPIVDIDDAHWAINMILKDAETVEARFAYGGLGGADIQMEYITRKAIHEYFDGEDNPAKKRVNKQLRELNVLPFSYINRVCGANTVFSSSNLGRDRALTKTINYLISLGDIKEINASELQKSDATNAELRLIKNNQRIFEKGGNYKENWEMQLEKDKITNGKS